MGNVNRFLTHLILTATFIEIEHLLHYSTVLSEQIFPSGIRIITASLGRTDFQIIITGAGVVNAAHGLTVYLENHKKHCIESHNKPPLIIQTGIAGFFENSGLQVGDIGVATSERYIHNGVGVKSSVVDVAVSSATEASFYSCYPNEPLPFDLVPNHPMSRHGHFSFDDTMVEQSCLIIETGIKNNLTKVKSSTAAAKKNNDDDDDEKENNFRVITGDFITVSTITATLEHAQHLFRAFNHPCMESMEGAASAHIAALYNIPFIEVRAASNPVGVRNKSQWNIPLACQRASFAVKSLLENGI